MVYFTGACSVLFSPIGHLYGRHPAAGGRGQAQKMDGSDGTFCKIDESKFTLPGRLSGTVILRI